MNEVEFGVLFVTLRDGRLFFAHSIRPLGPNVAFEARYRQDAWNKWSVWVYQVHPTAEPEPLFTSDANTISVAMDQAIDWVRSRNFC